jgi:hypothetical protein
MDAKQPFRVFIVAVCVLWLGAKAWGDESPLVEMESDVAKQYGGRLVELLKKEHKDLPVKLEADPDKAIGLSNEETHDGIILVPLKGFEEREPTDADKEKANGVGMCYLFLSPSLNPLVDGKPVDPKKMRTVTVKDEDGNEHKATCLVCSVKNIEGDDWQLFVYGADKEPLVKSSFEETADAPKKDLALTIKDVKDDKATLAINMFGKYCVTIPISHKRK